MSVKRGGEVKPVRKSRSRFPPVIVSTNWKSFGVLIVEPISSMLIVPRDEMPNMVPNFSAALATALSPS